MIEHFALGFLMGFILGIIWAIKVSLGDDQKYQREGYRRGVMDERARIHGTSLEIDYPEDLQVDEDE